MQGSEVSNLSLIVLAMNTHPIRFTRSAALLANNSSSTVKYSLAQNLLTGRCHLMGYPQVTKSRWPNDGSSLVKRFTERLNWRNGALPDSGGTKPCGANPKDTLYLGTCDMQQRAS